ncbi:MAG: 2-dehydropantoate 2-reductase [Solirubrobacteraceae bacterium]
MSRIAVAGPGGVGGFVAGALCRAGHQVIVVARESTAELIDRTGLRVHSVALDTDFTAHPRAVEELSEPVDVLLVATKAGGLAGALERIRVDPDLVVPLLNGVEHMALLRRRFGEHTVAAGVIRIESDRPEPGEVSQRSPGARIDLAGPPERVQSLAAALREAGLEIRTGASESQVLWTKLARLNALALTTSASNRPIGFIRTDPRWRSALEGAVAETVAVARAEGADLDPDETLAELESAHAELGSSMQRDIAAGQEPELDPIAGAVLRAGARHGIRCPTVSWLARRVAKRAGIAAPGPGT